MATGDSPFMEALRDRYVLERELGRGGMATVYLARDLKHDRLVALKVLHPDIAATLGPQRFLREIKLAARLQHPHILSVHDSGDAAGQLWFTMPYVEGESLRDRIRRDPQLPVDEAVQITREAAQALDYAHQHGVVHRDIKPENILLTGDGNVLVADFGIARALGGDEQLTATGVSVGTPAYMSPEQAAGDRAVDAKSDIYSLACVLYEMLAGEPPFTGPTAQAIIAKRFNTPVTSIRVVRPDVPEHIDLALTTALARAPAGRYASTGEFARALKTSVTRPTSNTRRVARMAAVAIGLLLLVAVVWNFLDRRKDPRLPTPDSRLTRLAVLPFDNLGDTADAYFAEGVSDEVRGKLASLSGLEVIARASSSQYKRTTKPARQIGQELGVHYLLTGTVRWEKRPGASRVRVSPELVDARSGAARWQAPFDAAITDVFEVQGEIAGRVAEALNVELGDQEERALTDRPTGNLPAYDAFLRGEAAGRRLTTNDPAALRRALHYYEQAVKLDSTFALAWSRISRAHSTLYSTSSSSPADSAASDDAARRAMTLAPGAPESHLALGHYFNSVVIDPHKALEEYRRGLALAPNHADLLSISTIPLQALGRWEEAAATARHALRLDPRSPRIALRVARAMIILRRFDEADAAADAAVRLDSSSPDPVWMKAMAHVVRGDLDGARAVHRSAPTALDRVTFVAYVAHFWELAWTLDRRDLDLLASLSPEPFGGERSDWGLSLAQAWALKGDSARARQYADTARASFQRMISRSARNSQDFALLGLSLAYLRRYDEAIAAAKQSLAQQGPRLDKYAWGYSQLNLARVYAMAGRRAEAIESLEALLEVPLFVTPGWLRIDPTFASLRGDPRFDRLADIR